MKYTRLACGVMAAAGMAALLAGCDPNKGGDASTPATPAESNRSTAPVTPNISFNKARKPDGVVTIKVITNGNSPFWDAMGIGLNVGQQATGVKGNWTAPSQTDNNSQKETFEQALAANSDGIAVSCIDAGAFTTVIDEGIAKGVPVITFDSDAPNSKRLAYIGTDNFAAGQEAGRAAVKLFPNGGNLVAFVGNMSADNAKKRYDGFMDAVKGHNINMLQAPYEDGKDAGVAHRNVADAITKYGTKLNGLVGLYSYNGPAIVDEVQKAGLLHKVKVICFDGEPRTLENLKRGLVDLTVVQKPYEFGRLSAILLNGINRKGLEQALKDMEPELTKNHMKVDMGAHIIDTGVQVITPENSGPFLKELSDKGLKST